MSLRAFAFLSLVVFVYSQNFAQIGTFEGTYNDKNYGGELYLCQNGDVLQGTFSEVGIINAVVSGSTAQGKFFIAGFNQCNTGNFSWTLTSEGFEGYGTCNGEMNVFRWVAKKYDVFRPTNDQCNLLYDQQGTVSGHWTMAGSSFTLDACASKVVDSVFDNYTLHASYQTKNMGEYFPNSGAIFAHVAFGDKIFMGSWYEDFVAGSVLGFINYKQELVLFFWTGIVGRQGATVIDSTELHNPAYHRVVRYVNSQRTSLAQCNRYGFLQTYVFDALPQYATMYNDYLYFFYNPQMVAPYVQNQIQNFQYVMPNPYASASYLTISVLAVIVVLFSF